MLGNLETTNRSSLTRGIRSYISGNNDYNNPQNNSAIKASKLDTTIIAKRTKINGNLTFNDTQ